MSGRPDRAAALLGAQATGRDVTAARLAIVPALELGATTEREEGDNLAGIAIGFSVPLFRRRQADLGVARAAQAAARAEVDAVQRGIRAEVTASAERLRRARLAERRFAAQVLAAAADNVALSEVAFQEGKVGIASVVVLRTAAVAAQLEYLEVLGDAYESWFALAAAVGADPQDVQGGRP
jgi:outer membrane protein TolC